MDSEEQLKVDQQLMDCFGLRKSTRLCRFCKLILDVGNFLNYENEEACQDLLSRFALIEEKKRDLAQYLCEDPSALKLEELFGTMKTFRGLFLKALKENQSHREQAICLEKRKKRMAEEEARRQTEDGGVVKADTAKRKRCRFRKKSCALQ